MKNFDAKTTSAPVVPPEDCLVSSTYTEARRTYEPPQPKPWFRPRALRKPRINWKDVEAARVAPLSPQHVYEQLQLASNQDEEKETVTVKSSTKVSTPTRPDETVPVDKAVSQATPDGRQMLDPAVPGRVVETIGPHTEAVRPLEEWAEVIRADLTLAVQGMIDAGQHLQAAKAQHPGTFRAWLDSKATGIRRMTAYRLMKVAEAFSSCPNLGQLPPDRTALYDLAKLDPSDLQNALMEGEIHAGMSCAEAHRLLEMTRRRRDGANHKLTGMENAQRVQETSGAYSPSEENPSVASRDALVRHIDSARASGDWSEEVEETEDDEETVDTLWDYVESPTEMAQLFAEVLCLCPEALGRIDWTSVGEVKVDRGQVLSGLEAVQGFVQALMERGGTES